MGVEITRTIHAACRASLMNSLTLDAAGAAQTTVYSTPGDLPLAFIIRERSPSPCLGAG
jgi:hypothetical protein